MENTKETKRVTLDLAQVDGNAFAIMGAFQQQARREGWTKEEINQVLTKCKSSDYDNLLTTVMGHTK